MATNNNEEEAEVQVGWDAKRLELVRHYVIALKEGRVKKLLTRTKRNLLEELEDP